MCWTGLETDNAMQDGTDFKGLLISFKMFLDLTPCYYSSTTDHDGWMMDIVLCSTLMFLYDHQTNRRSDLIWWASWDCWGSMIWYWEREKAAPALSCTTPTMTEVPLSKASICSVYCTFIVTAAEVWICRIAPSELKSVSTSSNLFRIRR